MGICDSKNQKKSQSYLKQSTAVNLTTIINTKKNKKCKTITFWDTKIEQNHVISEQKSYSPPPRLCFCSCNQSSNRDISYGQLNTPKERLNQEIQNKQSKQTLFGKTLRFQNISKQGQRQLFKHLPSNQ